MCYCFKCSLFACLYFEGRLRLSSGPFLANLKRLQAHKEHFVSAKGGVDRRGRWGGD